MKILWLINGLIPEIAVTRNIRTENCMGWLTGMLNGLLDREDGLDIVVAFPFRGEHLEGATDKIKYVSFAEKSIDKPDKKTGEEIKKIIESVKPDIIHIFGTEFPHTLAAVKAAEETGNINKTVINIQGLISKCAEHYYAGLPFRAIHKCTLHDFIKRDNVFGQKKAFARRGRLEIAALKKVKHAIGRTEWDKACVRQINGDINYHKCNETLREPFYRGKWEAEKCEPYSIFVTQGSYPLKGFHVILRAFADIVKKYPTARLYTTGESVIDACKLKNLKHKRYYTVYLKKLLRKYGLQDKVTFLGNLNAEEIKARLIKSNVFVLPSSLENSSNSLGEAMMLGVPCVASDVGGVKTFIRHGENGFIYPFDEPYMMTYFIEKIFEDKDMAERLSANAKETATEIFDGKVNAETLVSIYKTIASR